MKRFLAVAAIFLATATTGLAVAGPRDVPGGLSAQGQTVTLTPRQRADIARGLVRKWAPEIQRQGGSVGEWAVKLGRFVGTAEASNVQQAAVMPTYQAMMGVLQGQPASSESVAKSVVSSKALGSTIADTTYTPLPNGRCRVADSRVISSPLPGAVTRSIDTEDVASYASQGGNGSTAGDGSTNCGIPSFATALAISVTVLTVGNQGFFKIFENGQPFTTGNTVFYEPTVSASNDVIAKSCQACALELAVYSSTSVHYVIDVVGYFIRPEATALECVETANTNLDIAANGGTGNSVAPSCPGGYTPTATNCETTSWLMPIVYFQSGTCSARNNDTAIRTLRASRTCCRVPGR
jgi:hypothetical protein